MNALLALWLPILLSAVVVFFISSLVHMVFKWHAPDYRGFSNEDAVRAAIRAGHPAPGPLKRGGCWQCPLRACMTAAGPCFRRTCFACAFPNPILCFTPPRQAAWVFRMAAW